MSSESMPKNEISLWEIYISRSGRAIMELESSEQPRMAVNSSIRGHSSCPLNLKTWSLVSQKVAAACRKAVFIFKCWRDRSNLTWKDCSLFQLFPLILLRKVFIDWREAWDMIDLRGGMKLISLQGSLYRPQSPNPDGKRKFFFFLIGILY